MNVDIQGNSVKVNPNLLDNWYFVGGGSQLGDGQFPINSSGKTEWTEPGFIIDRWKTNAFENSKVTLSTSGLSIENNADIEQVFESSSIMVGKECTFSALDTNSNLYQVTFTWPLNTSIFDEFYNKDFFVRIVEKENKHELWFFQNLGNIVTTYIAVKLELGNKQTLAHEEDSGWKLNEFPRYAEQQMICSQYDPLTGQYIGLPNVTNKNLCNKNMLDNWYFGKNFVDQRQNLKNEHFDNASPLSYSIDRWLLGEGELLYTPDLERGLILSFHSVGNYKRFIQKTELTMLTGETWTLSVLMKIRGLKGKVQLRFCNNKLGAIAINGGIDLPEFSEAISDDDDFQVYSITYTNTTGKDIENFGVEILCYNTENDSLSANILAFKLEKGPIQTLAYFENNQWVLNEIPKYEEELTKCQRYQYSVLDSKIRNTQSYIVLGKATTTTAIFGVLPTPVTMREGVIPIVLTDCSADNPYLSFGTFSTGFAVNQANITSIDVYVRSNSGIVLQCIGSNFIPGNDYQVYIVAQNSHTLILDANL